MTVVVSHADLPYFERRLRERMEELRREVEAANARKIDESFTRVAGEVPDAVDSSVANVALDTGNAEIRRDSAELREVDEALGRVAAGSYGICLRCGQSLQHARLEAYPAASRHADCQEAHERELKLGRAL
jgi:RNA polymerase-binding transcription factor DksA